MTIFFRLVPAPVSFMFVIMNFIKFLKLRIEMYSVSLYTELYNLIFPRKRNSEYFKSWVKKKWHHIFYCVQRKRHETCPMTDRLIQFLVEHNPTRVPSWKKNNCSKDSNFSLQLALLLRGDRSHNIRYTKTEELRLSHLFLLNINKSFFIFRNYWILF